jgi:DNA-directed RNA polymerase sigma subunit (sigma70/sigma32)
LTPRERDVVRTRCLQIDPPSLATLSISIGVSPERVRQIEERGYHKLRDALSCSVA